MQDVHALVLRRSNSWLGKPLAPVESGSNYVSYAAGAHIDRPQLVKRGVIERRNLPSRRARNTSPPPVASVARPRGPRLGNARSRRLSVR
jgi:hypothetical protein